MIRTHEELYEKIVHCTTNMALKLDGRNGKRAVVLCGGTGCLSSDSAAIKEKFQQMVEEKGLADKVTVNQVGCFGFCSQGPFVKIYPEDTLYRLVKMEDVEEIIEKDLIGGEVVERLALDAGLQDREVGDIVATLELCTLLQVQVRALLEEERTAQKDTLRNHYHAALLGCAIDDGLQGLGLNQCAVLLNAVVGYDKALSECLDIDTIYLVKPLVDGRTIGKLLMSRHAPCGEEQPDQ